MLYQLTDHTLGLISVRCVLCVNALVHTELSYVPSVIVMITGVSRNTYKTHSSILWNTSSHSIFKVALNSVPPWQPLEIQADSKIVKINAVKC